MKKIKYIYRFFIVLILFTACKENLNDLSFADNISAPTNVTANYNIKQDNTGEVTITPNAEGATNYDVYFDADTTTPINLEQGESASNVYTEGTHDVKIVAYNLNGDKTEAIQQLVVSFKAPQNIVVVLENDAAISKQVNITVNADFASMFDFYSGEVNATEPVSGNIGETISYLYKEAGDYSIKIVAKGAAIATLEYTEEFTVTEILAPLEAAPNPKNRKAEDVVSIFSDAYTDVTLNELPTTWSSSGFEAITIDNNNVWKLTNLDFVGMVTNYDSGIDVSSMEKLHIDYWVPNDATNELLVKIVNTVDGGEDEESLGTTVGGSWQSIDLDITGFDGGDLANKNKITQILIDSDGISNVVYIDNFYFYKEPDASTTFNDGLLTNGDFENGSEAWLVGVDDNSSAPVVTDNGNTYYSVNVTAAGNPYDVNLSQKVEIIQGNTYTLTFDAWSDVNRPIIAGIGLSASPWSNTTETVNITPTRSTYSITLMVTEFGAIDARVIFDIGAAVGLVNIDNVSLIIGKGNVLNNSDFENGSESWLIGVDDNSSAPVVTDNDNTYYSVNVTAAGNPYDVNLSQKVEIVQGNTYTLTFDAWSDVNRPIIAGIGLSAAPWSNTAETVNITTEVTTYSVSLTATDFGATDARVIFDLGAAVGQVNIDNVSLSSN
ncbi:carbohydrate binding domain-containing protein [Polaribacter sp. KT 15]|uniref:carbohydrate binding domain-containing protein n=1 Tax=Polaribacter sp. KT 15 TaxID=1896175 RepID=UPI00090B792D|nr:carbohydrate binding domain-containing protein [Polaribacter sp. KT 15]SHN04585.1 Carbohydrate binding domain-containing protein [Polaribacter sp. KT 15]